MRWLIVSLFALAIGLPSNSFDTASVPKNDQREPKKRIRITVDDESLVVDLDGARLPLLDGRQVAAESVSTRMFEGPRAFGFEYQDGWVYSGSRDHREDGLGWWDLRGKRSSISLRRHDGDADEVREKYCSNLELNEGHHRRATKLLLGGRELEGWAIDVTVHGISHYPDMASTQYVFGWKENETTSWLLCIHRIEPFPSSREIFVRAPDGDRKSAGIVVDSSVDLSLGADPELAPFLSNFYWRP